MCGSNRQDIFHLKIGEAFYNNIIIYSFYNFNVIYLLNAYFILIYSYIIMVEKATTSDISWCHFIITLYFRINTGSNLSLTRFVHVTSR